MVKKSLIIISLLVIVLFSCSKEKDEVTPINVGYSYAGLNLGSYIVYDVDSHHYNLPFNIDTIVQFQIKEVVDSKYTDLEGEEAFKIIRYRRDSVNGLWVVLDVWNSKITATNYQKVEENVRFVKLVFPVRENTTWNGNVKNVLGEQIYEYTSAHKQETVGTLVFDSVATILQFEDVNLVQERLFEEKFAAGVGLVYKKTRDVNNAFSSSQGLWFPDVGEDVTYTVSSFVK